MLDAQLFGLAPAGHHATSVLLHATSAALLFEVLAGMTGTPWRSAFVAAVFALHPLRVESVAWVSERKDVLAGFFWMLALAAYARWARRAVFSPHRPLPITEVAASCVVLLVVSALAIRERRRHPWLLVGWLWYLATLLPVIGLVKVGEQAMADRFTYLPQIGVLIMVTWTAAEMVGSRAVLGATAVAAVAGCVALTTRQLEVWRDSVSLFAHATAATRDNYVAEGNLGAALLDQGRRADAVAHLRHAATINPGYAKVRVSLEKAPAESGDPVGAHHQFADSILPAPNPHAA